VSRGRPGCRARCGRRGGRDDRARNRQTLARAAPDFLGREERVEHPLARVVRDAAAGVRDRDRHLVAGAPGSHPDRAPLAAVGDRVRRIDQHIDEHLPDLAVVGGDRRQVAEVGLDVGHPLYWD
jgi:hypothetical protein